MRGRSMLSGTATGSVPRRRGTITSSKGGSVADPRLSASRSDLVVAIPRGRQALSRPSFLERRRSCSTVAVPIRAPTRGALRDETIVEDDVGVVDGLGASRFDSGRPGYRALSSRGRESQGPSLVLDFFLFFGGAYLRHTVPFFALLSLGKRDQVHARSLSPTRRPSSSTSSCGSRCTVAFMYFVATATAPTFRRDHRVRCCR